MSAGPPAAPDVLVVGSGPCGSAVARLLLERVPKARVLVADAGPRLGGAGVQAGVNVRNLDATARAQAEALCATAERGPRSRPVADGEAIEARPGTHLLVPIAGGRADDVPGAAYSSNLGGMAAHWTCVVPRPSGSERTPFMRPDRMEEAFATAERLLGVTAEAYPPTAVAESVRRAIEDRIGHLVEGARPIQPMPLACAPRGDGRQPLWAGVDTILGTWPSAQVAPDTLCRRVLVGDGRVSGAVLEDRRTRAHHTIRCGVVVVAAGSFHTPQLLWVSGIRPPALGRYLNVHPQVVATVSTGPCAARIEPPPGDDREHLRAVYWIPFNDLAHPWHGQVLVAEPPGLGAAIVGIAWYVPKAIDAQCRVEFADDRRDARGLPAPSVVHSPTATDRRVTAQALSIVTRVATAIGPYVEGGAPRVLVSGKSLHYQGTTRMGATDDGTSVCDPTGQVWGVGGLYVAGPNVIPTATACNPTLTAVAFAGITAEAVARALVEP